MAELVTVYALRDDTDRLRQMQKLSKDRNSTMGLSLEPALVGSRKWWRRIESGQLTVEQIEGRITAVRWGSMGDWPEFSISRPEEQDETFTREGDHTRYVEGLMCRVRYVLHPWKTRQSSLGTHSRIVLQIWVEDSAQRSDPQAPGPGGVGLR